MITVQYELLTANLLWEYLAECTNIFGEWSIINVTAIQNKYWLKMHNINLLSELIIFQLKWDFVISWVFIILRTNVILKSW